MGFNVFGALGRVEIVKVSGSGPLPPVDHNETDPLKELWERSRRGERAALRELLESVAPELARVARSFVGPADLDDVVQESLMSLLQALPGFRGDCSVRRFAYRIAVRAAIRWRRRVNALQTRREGYAQEQVTVPALTPMDGCARSRRKQLLQSLLIGLPEPQAETLTLRVVLGFTLEETAEATGVPVNTVRSRMRLARAALRERIEADAALLDLLEEP